MIDISPADLTGLGLSLLVWLSLTLALAYQDSIKRQSPEEREKALLHK